MIGPDPLDRVFSFEQPDADGFRAGHYLHRRRGHVDMPVIVWFGPPLDLENGGEMDRSPRWQVTIAGVLLTEDERVAPGDCMARLDDVWPRVLGGAHDQGEIDYRQARVDYGRRNDPEDPYAHRRGRVDLLTATP